MEPEPPGYLSTLLISYSYLFFKIKILILINKYKILTKHLKV